MEELKSYELEEINGGGMVSIWISIYLGVGVYKLLRSKRGYIKLPWIQFQWG